MISNLDFDKRRKEKEKEEEEEKKFGNSKPRHFPKEMAEAKTVTYNLFLTFILFKVNRVIRGGARLFSVREQLYAEGERLCAGRAQLYARGVRLYAVRFQLYLECDCMTQ